MRHKWKKKNNKRRGGESNKENVSFFTRRGSFLKTDSNYTTFHTWFTPGSSALYLEAKHFCHTLWGKIKADANGPEFGGLGEGRKYMILRTAILGSFYFPQSRWAAKSLFRVTLKGHTLMKLTIGSLRKYKAIHYLLLKKHNKRYFPLLLRYWTTSLWELWVAHWKDAWLS